MIHKLLVYQKTVIILKIIKIIIQFIKHCENSDIKIIDHTIQEKIKPSFSYMLKKIMLIGVYYKSFRSKTDFPKVAGFEVITIFVKHSMFGRYDEKSIEHLSRKLKQKCLVTII